MFFKTFFPLVFFSVLIVAEQGDEPFVSEPVSYVVCVTKETFEKEVLNSDLPVIVDGHAPWCLACQIMKTTFEYLSKLFHGKMKFVLIDVQQDFPFSQELDIKFLPTFIFFKDGKEVDRMIGWMNDEDFLQKLEAMI